MAQFDNTLDDPIWVKLELQPDKERTSEELIESEAGVWASVAVPPQPFERLRFVPVMGACPRCKSSLVSGEVCGLCELDICRQLFDCVEELMLRPSSEGTALRSILKTLDVARKRGRPLLRIVHGVDQGGIARTLAWHLTERGDLRNWVIGDVLGDRVQVGRELAEEWPILRWSSDWNAENQGVTWLVIEPLHLSSHRFNLLQSPMPQKLLT